MSTVSWVHGPQSSASAPVRVRAYQKEAEFEIWKQKSDGQYALLKTYPMCRWSGQLGPKRVGQTRQRKFARAVGRHMWHGDFAANGRNVNNATSAPDAHFRNDL